jgi:enamine deaminase RidA (YjgF/YER057c/UK114 family)
MAEGRPGRPGRLVEIDQPLLDGHEQGHGRGELRHGSPGSPARNVSVRPVRAAGDANCNVVARPAVDLAQSLHGGETSGMTPTSFRRRISSGTAFEERVGYSRAVRIGDQVWVSGTAPIMPGDADPPAGPYEQAKLCLDIIERALVEAGAVLDDVVRTRIYVVDAALIDEVGRAHAEAFATARPATTGIVAQLLDPRWLVEIEAEAVILRP